MQRQLAFDLPVRASHARGDFFVSPANAAAVAMIDRPDDWPNGRLVLSGPEGSGKTHLVHVWAAASRAPVLRAEALSGAEVERLGALPALAVEDWDGLPRASEEAAFHLVNLLQAARGHLLCTARSAPAAWTISLPDLLSRMQASGVARLDPPDDALFANLILKLFSDRQIAPEPALIPWLVARLERSFAAAKAAVDALDAAALAERRGVTRALARRVLDIGSVTET